MKKDIKNGYYYTTTISGYPRTRAPYRNTYVGDLTKVREGKPFKLVGTGKNAYITLISHLTGEEEKYILDDYERDEDGSVTQLNFTGEREVHSSLWAKYLVLKNTDWVYGVGLNDMLKKKKVKLL